MIAKAAIFLALLGLGFGLGYRLVTNPERVEPQNLYTGPGPYHVPEGAEVRIEACPDVDAPVRHCIVDPDTHTIDRCECLTKQENNDLIRKWCEGVRHKGDVYQCKEGQPL